MLDLGPIKERCKDADRGSFFTDRMIASLALALDAPALVSEVEALRASLAAVEAERDAEAKACDEWREACEDSCFYPDCLDIEPLRLAERAHDARRAARGKDGER